MVLKMNKLTSNRGNMLREVQLMNRLSHPNILRFMGVCVHQGQLHALTEYINGGNLEQLLDSPVPLSWSTRVQLALDIAHGLHYLHSKGIFHRDLTSKNCLVRCEASGYTAVVGDFGLAEKIPTYSEGSEKEPLAVVGSPYWMAPEVLRGEIYNEKADVFAYGIILCETIARVPADPDYLPRTEDFGLDVTAFRTMVGIDCPAAFLQLAFHCCSMEPTSRPSFLEITQCLEGILQHQLAGRVASHAKQSPLHKLGMQHLQPDQHLSRSQSDMFPSKLPTLPQLPEPCGGARTKEMPLRINPFSQREDLKGGKIKLFDTPSKSVISLTFDLPPPGLVACDFLVPVAAPHKCHSLPTSPELPCHGGLALGVKSPAQPPSLKWSREDAGEPGSGTHASPPVPQQRSTVPSCCRSVLWHMPPANSSTRRPQVPGPGKWSRGRPMSCSSTTTMWWSESHWPGAAGWRVASPSSASPVRQQPWSRRSTWPCCPGTALALCWSRTRCCPAPAAAWGLSASPPFATGLRPALTTTRTSTARPRASSATTTAASRKPRG
uniref:dual-specificity kinase n=1 Tax=Anser brachyrhynchus TaxID=132585 RepID=A0A8B9ID76_9AVES